MPAVHNCWAVLWGCHGKMAKLHYLAVSCWDLSSCPWGCQKIIWRKCTILTSTETWVVLWGCWKKLHYLEITETCWSFLWGCQKNMKKLYYLNAICSQLLGCGRRGNRWRSRTNLTLIFETCWAFFRGCQKNTKKLHDLSINSCHLLVCPLRLSREKKKKLRYFDVSCQDLVNCPLRLSEKNLKKLHYLAISWGVGCPLRLLGKTNEEMAVPWNHLLRLVGFSFDVVRKIWRNWTTLTLVLDRCWAVLRGSEIYAETALP